MGRTRISTTVDEDLLARAREVNVGSTDAALIDDALAALLARFRSAETAARYESAYRTHPLNEPEDWGDLASFREGVSAP